MNILNVLFLITSLGSGNAVTEQNMGITSPEPTLAQSQSFSPKCSTPSGICFVPAMPVGSICYCGSSQGTIIP